MSKLPLSLDCLSLASTFPSPECKGGQKIVSTVCVCVCVRQFACNYVVCVWVLVGERMGVGKCVCRGFFFHTIQNIITHMHQRDL